MKKNKSILIRVSDDFLSSIDYVLVDGESRSDFIRKAVHNRVRFLIQYNRHKKSLKASINNPDKHCAISKSVEVASYVDEEDDDDFDEEAWNAMLDRVGGR